MQNPRIHWRIVESSTVAAIGWSKNGMYVLFKKSGLYYYHGVSRQRAVVLAHAVRLTRDHSVGKYLNSRVKGAYPYRRVA